MMKKPTDIYMRKTGYKAKAFLLGLTAALMKGYAAQQLHANVTETTTILIITLPSSMQTRAPTARGKRQ